MEWCGLWARSCRAMEEALLCGLVGGGTHVADLGPWLVMGRLGVRLHPTRDLHSSACHHIVLSWGHLGVRVRPRVVDKGVRLHPGPPPVPTPAALLAGPFTFSGRPSPVCAALAATRQAADARHRARFVARGTHTTASQHIVSLRAPAHTRRPSARRSRSASTPSWAARAAAAAAAAAPAADAVAAAATRATAPRATW